MQRLERLCRWRRRGRGRDRGGDGKMKYQKYLTVLQMAIGVTASNRGSLMPLKRKLWWVGTNGAGGTAGRAGQGRAGGAAPGRARAAAGRAGGGFPQGTTAACGAPCRDPVGAPSESGPAAPGGHLRGRKFPANSPPVVWKTPAGGGGGAGGAVRAAPRLASPALGPAGGHPARRFARLETGIPLVMTHACDRTLWGRPAVGRLSEHGNGSFSWGAREYLKQGLPKCCLRR